MISAVDQIESVVRCIELGAEDYLPKPFNPTLLRARVGASLEKKRLRDELVAHLARIERELDSAREHPARHGAAASSRRPPRKRRRASSPRSSPRARSAATSTISSTSSPTNSCVVIADVSGKGAPAALFMARTKSARAHVVDLLRGNADTPEPQRWSRAMNDGAVRGESATACSATVFLATIDLVTRELHYCNCGHPRPYVVSADGVSELRSPRAAPLGIRRTRSTPSHRAHPARGRCLFLFTDGVTEAMNENDEQFSEARLEEVLRSVAAGSTQVVVTSVVEAVRRFAGHAPQSDDIAALAVRLVG